MKWWPLVAEAIPLDSRWLAAHPLPELPSNTDKNSRGRVLAIGGSRFVAGGLKLTGEAALRAGAGKLQFATIGSVALALGLAVPEAGVIALPEDPDGELGEESCNIVEAAVEKCDCVVLGPAMTSVEAALPLLRAVLETLSEDQAAVLDAAAVEAARRMPELVKALNGRVVITPHAGEMAALLDEEADAMIRDPAGAVDRAVDLTGAVVMLKGEHSLLGSPDGALLDYAGGGAGLATGGSGDVLAGILAGLLARGQAPFDAAAWAIWLHGEAGRRLSEERGPLGYLARELSPTIPALMRGVI